MTWCIILLRRWYTKAWTRTATGLRYVGVSWHIWKGSISAERCKVLSEQHLLHADVSQEGLCVWAGRRWTADCFYNSLTASKNHFPMFLFPFTASVVTKMLTPTISCTLDEQQVSYELSGLTFLLLAHLCLGLLQRRKLANLKQLLLPVCMLAGSLSSWCHAWQIHIWPMRFLSHMLTSQRASTFMNLSVSLP